MRENVKTVTKHYDKDTVNGWDLSYEYESQDGATPVDIKVTGTKDSGSVHMAKAAANTSVSFGGGATMDAVLVASVQAEFEAIAAQFE